MTTSTQSTASLPNKTKSTRELAHFGFNWDTQSDVPVLIIVALCCWGISYALFGDDIVGPNSQLFQLTNPVRQNFALLWKFFEPISFGLIGMEVNFSILDGFTVLWGTICMLVPLLFRVLTSFASTYWTHLNLKENIFVAISWIPKATVQAALGPVALDMARENTDEDLIEYGNTVVVIAVISIIITSPIGAVLIMQLGPKFLHRTVPENCNVYDNPRQDNTEEAQL